MPPNFRLYLVNETKIHKSQFNLWKYQPRENNKSVFVYGKHVSIANQENDEKSEEEKKKQQK